MWVRVPRPVPITHKQTPIVERIKVVEKKYNVYMDGVVIDRNVTREEADELVESYLDADEFEDEEHYYMIKPVQ